MAMESGDLQTTDRELVERARRGHHAAFHELVDRHASSLYGLAMSLIGNEADAEDVLQETFTGAYRGLRGFKGRSSAKTWLARILVRQVARYFRKSKRRSSHILRLDDASLSEPVAPAAPKPDVGMDVDAAIQSLSTERREVIVLRELQGMSYEEISQVLGIPCGTVESRLFRARKELQERLSDYLT